MAKYTSALGIMNKQNIFFRIAKKARRLVYQTEFEKTAKQWFVDNGDLTHRLNYPELNSESVVFDVGAYVGDFAEDIVAKYSCSVHAFEPAKKYYDGLSRRFAGSTRVKCWNFGLGDKNETIKLSILDDASTTFTAKKSSVYCETIEVVDILEFIKKENITHIDLMKINIEGGEYALLNRLLEDPIVGKINNIQVQFHNFVDNAEQRMMEIQAMLSKSHELTYQYKFIWENWRLRP
ncbi:FkbM family methyltransferase [Bdellovibrio sp. HCB290]|uniref:FkbM family methyltransferase n=1 Tax=Bdellovibrio sp. HCB290 TaxID=3394356 RepID=UPI0039B67830